MFLQTQRTKYDCYCSAQMYGTFRIAIQYCDGSNWLTMQPPQKSSKKPNRILGKQKLIYVIWLRLRTLYCYPLPEITGIINISYLIISMTKLLHADWLRSVQLFHLLYSSTINDFAKTNKRAGSKIAEGHLNTKEIAPEELKAKA